MVPINEEVWDGTMQMFERCLYNKPSQSTMCGLVMTAMCDSESYEKQMLTPKIYKN